MNLAETIAKRIVVQIQLSCDVGGYPTKSQLIEIISPILAPLRSLIGEAYSYSDHPPVTDLLARAIKTMDESPNTAEHRTGA